MDDPFAKYMRDIGGLDLLTAEQEQDLGRKILQGDVEARDLMIRSNIRLTFHIARSWQGRGMSFEDLVMEGTLGLIRATESFDPERKLRFATYACYWIRQSIQRALLNYARLIRIPTYMYDLMSEWRKTENALKDKGQDASPARIAKIMGVEKKKVPAILSALRLTTFNEGSDEDKSRFLDLIAAKDKDEDGVTSMQEEIQIMLAEMENLTSRERKVLKMRFGLDAETVTLKEIGEELGVTRERVRQIESLGLSKLLERITRREVAFQRRRGLTTAKPR